VHTLSALQAVLLLTQGLLWPKLKLGVVASWTAFWCSLHGTFAILAAYTVAAVWGVGNETIMLMGELPHGLSRGSPFQETFIKVLAYSSAPTGLTCFALILGGLRTGPTESDVRRNDPCGVAQQLRYRLRAPSCGDGGRSNRPRSPTWFSMTVAAALRFGMPGRA